MMEDLEQLLRLPVGVAALHNTCQALAAVALGSPAMSTSVEGFCEGIYAKLVDLLGPLTSVPPPPLVCMPRPDAGCLQNACLSLSWQA